ncbi:MAG: hypothetical protein ACLQIQ_12115 [Beijerinckiaceae bacterium]
MAVKNPQEAARSLWMLAFASMTIRVISGEQSDTGNPEAMVRWARDALSRA